jgi:hypothetical protein
MEIPNIFKNRTGAIQLSDLDDNFSIVKVTVNSQETQLAALKTQQDQLELTLANFSAIPIGCIIMWSGSISTIPSGWLLCNGTNGTPDLRDKFVVGARADSTGSSTTFITGADTKSGGYKDSVVVSHVHPVESTATVSSDTDTWTGTITSTDASLYGTGSFYNAGSNWTSNNTQSNWENRSVGINHTHTHTHTVGVTTTIETVGDSGTNRNLPPYYSLAFIMKV